MNRIEDRTKNILAQVFDTSYDEIDEDSSIHTIGNWNSFRHMNMVLSLEDEFKVEINQNQVVQIINYKTIIKVLTELGCR
jgi:acyl carrier protein